MGRRSVAKVLGVLVLLVSWSVWFHLYYYGPTTFTPEPLSPAHQDTPTHNHAHRHLPSDAARHEGVPSRSRNDGTQTSDLEKTNVTHDQSSHTHGQYDARNLMIHDDAIADRIANDHKTDNLTAGDQRTPNQANENQNDRPVRNDEAGQDQTSDHNIDIRIVSNETTDYQTANKVENKTMDDYANYRQTTNDLASEELITTEDRTHASNNKHDDKGGATSYGRQLGAGAPREACRQVYQQEKADLRRVVLWTPFWQKQAAWEGMVSSRGRLRGARCPTWRCEFVWTQEATEKLVGVADAVVFFSVDLTRRPLPPRSPRQLWIWLELEAPPISQLASGPWTQAEKDGVYFNLTMSYHHLNDIVVSQGYLLPLGIPPECPVQPDDKLNKSSPTFRSYSEHLRRYDAIMLTRGRREDDLLRSERTRQYDEVIHTFPDILREEGLGIPGNTTGPSTHVREGYDDATTHTDQSPPGEQSGEEEGRPDDSWFTRQEVRWGARPRLAAWMASHCPTESRRESLVAALRRHVNITTVGKCGDLACGKNHMDTYCYRWLAGSHLFYLSFENALCDDYVTEKVWRPLEYGMVPVVYGGCKYSDTLPFGSYIDAMEFSSAEALARRLVYLANHPSAYLRYLQWRRYWRAVWPAPWCNLCAELHRDHRHPTHVTLDKWWETTTDCYDPLMW